MLPEESALSLLPRRDAYALARALVGLPWSHVPVSPLVQSILSQLDVNRPEDNRLLRRILTPDVLRQILAEDPNHPLPDTSEPPIEMVPELPASAQLNTAQKKQARSVGRWLDDYLQWAGAAANETPLCFHEGIGLYLVAVAIGRRLYISTPWRQRVHPNIYVMIVAISTYYRKSAGLNLATEITHASIPHMILPQPGSPENFMNMLGGVLPPNFEDIPLADRERLTKGNTFAAQRGILRDEISALFKSMGKDYMAGLKELIMQLYDCPPYLDSNTNQRGLVVIRDTALSILGATTPAELGSAISVSDWYNGNLARFALLTPEPEYAVRPPQAAGIEPSGLAQRLRALHEKLPPPPAPTALGNTPPAESWSLVADIWTHCHAYEQALREMTAPNSRLDDRLRAVYGRLHVQALKIAILLAALDWADVGQAPRPEVRPAHWFRAQLIAETWRASAHRLLRDLSENEELRLEDRILGVLAANPDGLTLRNLYRTLKSTRKLVMDAVSALMQDRRIIKLSVGGTDGRPGPRPDIYRRVE